MVAAWNYLIPLTDQARDLQWYDK